MNILIGVSAGIAAYKIPELVSRLIEKGHLVKVVLTQHATEFVSPLVLQALTKQPVYRDLWDDRALGAMPHIELAKWADQLLIAPATANILAKLAHGLADDLLSNIVLASRAHLMVAPAMNQAMWSHPATQANLAILRERQIEILGPAIGQQACGDFGLGRLLDLEVLLTYFENTAKSLQGQTVLINAGPTREFIDPIRYFSNTSSGKMGYALAAAAKEAGAVVHLISGPCDLRVPSGVFCEEVESACDMEKAVMSKLAACDIFIACAAVADYRPRDYSPIKLKKQTGPMHIDLVRNPDILEEIALLEKKPFIVGFAAESVDLEKNARKKLKQKKMDMMVANAIREDAGFGKAVNQATLFFKDDSSIALPVLEKSILAKRVIAEIASWHLGKNQQHNHQETGCKT